jgi:hypothetical protein
MLGHTAFRPQISEEELLSKEVITPEDVLRLNKITENYLCPPEANVFGIDFTRYGGSEFPEVESVSFSSFSYSADRP